MFRLSGGDLFALIDSPPAVRRISHESSWHYREQAQQLVDHRSSLDEPLQWWFAGGHLYEVMLAPIYFGPKSDNTLLGVVAVGYEMNTAVARQVSQVAASQVAIVCGTTVVVSTLNADQTNELRSHLTREPIPTGPADWKLGRESFVVSALDSKPRRVAAGDNDRDEVV